MGRSRENKAEVIADLKNQLADTQLALIIDYPELSVAEITDLRNRLRPTGTVCKVTKNTFMRIAIAEEEVWKPMKKFLKGPSAFLLVKDDIGGAFKAYQEFKKDTKKTEFRIGVMQGQALNQDQVKAIADLPTKEELMAQVAGAINSITARVAISVKEVPASLARSVNEIPASLGRVLQALKTQKEDSN